MGKSKSSTKKPSRYDIATKAVGSLKKLEESLQLDPAMLPHEAQRSNGFRTVPAKAIAIAANIVGEHPDRFSDFDVAEMNGAVELELAMAPLVTQARALASHVEKTVLKQRAQAAENTLVLYATMKGLARLQANEPVREQVRELKALLKRRRKSHTAPKAVASPPVHAPAPAAVASPTATHGVVAPAVTNGAVSPAVINGVTPSASSALNGIAAKSP